MTESCATCHWARPAVSRVRTEAERRDGGFWDWAKGSPPDYHAERRRCVRMPQAVENDADYLCGEYLAARKDAA